MPSIAEVPEYTRKRRREEDDCEQKSGKSCSSYGFFHRAPSPEFSDLNRTLQRPIKPLSNKRQRVIPLNNHEAPKCLYDIMELVGQTRNSDAIEVKKKIDLSPCHICRRKPTSKHELDGFADCEGCGERTCYVCIRECLGSGSAFTDEDMGVGREYDIDPDRDEIEGTQVRPPWGSEHTKTHRGMICSRCCVEKGSEGEVWCLGCLNSQDER